MSVMSIMPNTYSQIYIHVVFSPKGRQSLIEAKHREELHKYISGVVTNKGQKLLAIFCMPDHIHILLNLQPNVNTSDIVRDIKANSSRFINEQGWIKGKFNWQEGFGAFSAYGRQLDTVIKYILNQEEHHRKKTFREEYFELLKEFEIEFDEKYLFEWIE